MKSMMKLQVTSYELQVKQKAESRRQKRFILDLIFFPLVHLFTRPPVHSFSICNRKSKLSGIFLVLVCLFCFLTVFAGAQNYVTFEYDASGNNVSRTIYMSNPAPPAPSPPPAPSAPPPQISEQHTFAGNQENTENYGNENPLQPPSNYQEEGTTDIFNEPTPDTFNKELPETVQNDNNMDEDATLQLYTDIISETVINIYPNPTKGKLAVKISGLPEHSFSSLTLLNIQGTVIMQQQPLTDYNELDISAQPDGMYIMQITIDAKSTTWRIIKN